MLQPAIAKQGEQQLSVRARYMIETIHKLKNNRMKSGVAASTVTSEATMRMKKILGSLNARTTRPTEPLRLGLSDIRNSDAKGKWWLVGASWKNDDDAPRPHENGDAGDVDAHDRIGSTDDGPNLVQMAREQRMNTDIRRAIFVTIMSASDYRDAQLRLTKLRLRKAQQLEIPRVLIHCAGAEQVYNPYYTLIASRLCADHKLKMAFQFAMWDLFKKMGEGEEDDAVGPAVDDEDDDDAKAPLGMRTMVSLSRMFGTLIAHDALSLGVLKVRQRRRQGPLDDS